MTFSNILTAWSRVLEKLVVTQLVKYVSAFYETRISVTVFIKTRHWIMYRSRWIYSSHLHLYTVELADKFTVICTISSMKTTVLFGTFYVTKKMYFYSSMWLPVIFRFSSSCCNIVSCLKHRSSNFIICLSVHNENIYIFRYLYDIQNPYLVGVKPL